MNRIVTMMFKNGGGIGGYFLLILPQDYIKIDQYYKF